jgi:hypothetical protein
MELSVRQLHLSSGSHLYLVLISNPDVYVFQYAHIWIREWRLSVLWLAVIKFVHTAVEWAVDMSGSCTYTVCNK